MLWVVKKEKAEKENKGIIKLIKEIKLDIEKETLPQVSRKEPWGFELQVDIGGCNNNISDPEKIKDFIIKLCDKIDMVRYKDKIFLI